MLEYCMKIYETYLNDELIKKEYRNIIIQQSEIDELIYKSITWLNLEDIYCKYGVILPFTIWYRKKGRQISFFSKYKDIKEWKTSSPNMYLKIYYKKRQASLKDITSYYNSDLSIQYLVERGLSVVG